MLSKKFTIANAITVITSPITAFSMVFLADCTLPSSPAEVAYCIPPTMMNITAIEPEIPNSKFVIVPISSPKLAGPPRPAGAVSPAIYIIDLIDIYYFGKSLAASL